MLTEIEGQNRKKFPKLEERLVDSSIFFWLFQRHSFPTLHHTEEPQRWALMAIHDFISTLRQCPSRQMAFHASDACISNLVLDQGDIISKISGASGSSLGP